MDLQNQFKEIWKKYNPATDEHGKFLLNKFIEYRKDAEKQYYKAYYFALILGTLFYFLDSHLTKDIIIFDIKIDNLSVVKWCILPIISFISYQGIISFLQENYYRQIIFDYLETYLPELDKNDLVDLINGVSFFNFERVQANKFHSKWGSTFALVIAVILIFVPLFILFYILYKNIRNWSEVNSLFFKFSICIITLILISRIVMIIVSVVKSAIED